MTTELTPERLERIVSHMNDDHPASMVDYCRAFGDEPSTTTAKMIALNGSGFDVQATTVDGPRLLHFNFASPLTEAVAIRDALIKMATDALAVLGDDAMGAPSEH